MLRPKLLLLPLLFFAVSFSWLHNTLHAQEIWGNFYHSHPLADSMKQGLSLSGQVLTYFKNNEYFSPSYPGFTALGYQTQLALQYKKNHHSIILGGMYTGRMGSPMRHEIKPIIQLQYQVSKNWDVTMGTLNGAANHQLTQEIRGLDYLLYDPLEYGVQLRYTPKWLHWDTWIDWQKNIVWNDTTQEVFTLGSVARFIPLNRYGWKIQIPIGLCAYHTGGQIDIVDRPTTTQFNILMEVDIAFTHRKTTHRLRSNVITWNNDDTRQVTKWDNGSSANIRYSLERNQWVNEIGLRFSDSFFAPWGDHLFTTYNKYNGTTHRNNKSIWSFQSFKTWGVNEDFSLQFGAGFFYINEASHWDYCYLIAGKYRFAK